MLDIGARGGALAWGAKALELYNGFETALSSPLESEPFA
jgi:hypothetical protein